MEALGEIVKEKYVHDNIKWQNISLLSLYTDSGWRVKPILIDLNGAKKLGIDDGKNIKLALNKSKNERINQILRELGVFILYYDV